jgi:peptide/nickel transport system substrate-binding protein
MDDIKRLGELAAQGKLNRRDFMKKAAALGLAIPFAGTFLSQSVQAATPKSGGHLVVGVTGSSTDSLDPATWAGHLLPTFGKTWGETLVEPHPSDKSPVPVLAESWDVDSSASKWVFNIRKGVTFHNGQEMSSADVVKTLQRHSQEDSKSAALGIMRDIESIQAEGPHKVVITLKSGNADLPLLLSDYHLIIQPGGGYDKPDAGIGTGPYKVEAVEPGIRYLSKKVPGHWRSGVGYVDSIEVLAMNDSTARMSALRSGRVHMINQVDPKTAKLLANMPGISVENTEGGGHYVFAMQTNTAPFDNQDLRLALKYAVDREEMVKRILHGYGSVGNDFPVNATYALFAKDIEQRAFDPDKAKFHYKKSGHSGPVQLFVSDGAFPGAVDAATLFQSSAARSGIKLDVKREPADGYWSNVWNVKPFCASYWTTRPVQDHIYSTAYKSGVDWNETKWSRPAFDQLLVQARTELDQAQRQKLYRDMAMMVRDDGGVIVPMFNDYIDGVSSKVQGYQKDSSGPLSNYFAPIRCWLA